ncbi:MAG: DUF1553 domain-containing protein [Acidobacteria bacterium]|nr:DUF1553 domain-containing protein [Acidobacteriota bacterium]
MGLRRSSLAILVLPSFGLIAQPVSYTRDVQPLLAAKCVACHQAANRSGGLSLSSFAALSSGGAHGPAIVTGANAESPLLSYVTGNPPRMPKAGAPLTAEQVGLLRRWIEQGAADDSGGKAEERWWSLRALRKPAIPAAAAGPGRTAVDAFIADKLKQNNLQPSPEADRRTLIRRLYFDLHGLPPTPEQVAAFIEDPSPTAYEALVDRLLASPHYGERWARHWLDIVHYGDSHGYDKDKPRPNAWPYRDYVIGALNADKPYARFVREQIAGDVLYPEDARAMEATGFLAAGPWDFVGHQELKEGTTDKNLTRVLDRDDMVTTTVSTFVSEYYNLQAVFAGVDRADRPYDEDPATNRRRRELLRQKQAAQLKLQPYLDKVEFVSSPELVELDNRIQDAGLLIVHLGEPKNAAQAAEKKQLEERRTADRARRQTVVDALVGTETYATIAQLKKDVEAVDQLLAQLPAPKLIYSGANFFTRAGAFRPSLQPRPVHLLERGSVTSPGALAVPGALSALPGVAAKFALPDLSDEGARRAALANWIADDANVLTWRSIVNRVWHYHFGTGLVDTPSDFGRMGSLPSHPELLDYLAVWFRDEAHGSLKQLHRLLVTSATYRQASRNIDAAAKIDSDNRLLWRMNRSRLDAEALRDTVLSMAGKLDLTMGGPAVRMFAFKDDHSPIYDYARFDPDAPGAHRRSIYRFIVRSVPDPFMERLDCPDPSIQTPKRTTTLTAIQALAMLNNPFMVRMSEHLASRVEAAGSSTTEQVSAAVRLVLNRPPTASELPLYRTYAEQHGLKNLCRLLLNTNEFLFID